jgi:hypothetical protein
MRVARSIAYRLGLRPRPGSLLFSPSLDLLASLREADILGALERGMRGER